VARPTAGARGQSLLRCNKGRQFLRSLPVWSRIESNHDCGLNTLLPQAVPEGAASTPPPEDIVVTVRGDGTALLDREALSLTDLRDRLAGLFKTSPRYVVFVRGARDLEYARVAEVIDLVHGAGVSQVALMTE